MKRGGTSRIDTINGPGGIGVGQPDERFTRASGAAVFECCTKVREMILAHKIKLNPTAEQEEHFRKAVGTVRFAFNWGLAEWQRQYEAGKRPSAWGLQKQFNAIKHEQFPWVSDVSGWCTAYGFTRLGAAFTNFFRRAEKGEKPGYPKFKSRHSPYQSFYIPNDRIKLSGHEVYMPRLGWVNMAEELRFEGKIMSAVVSSGGGYWWISIAVEMPDPETAVTGEPIGVDLGVKDTAVCSNGLVFENQKHLKKSLKKMRRLNRELARREKGSNGWLRTKQKLARLHGRIRNQRQDGIHKMTTQLVKEYGVIGLETLNVQGMMQNGRLAQAVGDVGMYEIKRQLKYKAALYGAQVVEIDTWFPSSKLCSACGEKKPELTLAERVWTCETCGTTHDRDMNAAVNIKNEALRLVSK
jgi:putative transposase